MTWIYVIVFLLSLGLSIFAIVNNVDPEYVKYQSQFVTNLQNKWKILMYKIGNNICKLKFYIKTFINKMFKKH